MAKHTINNPITSLHQAVIEGNIVAAIALIDTGADVNAVDNLLATPLHEAAQNGHIEIIKLLLNRGANKNAQTSTGNTPLHIGTKFGRKNTVQLLLDAGADTTIKNGKGNTPADEAGTSFFNREMQNFWKEWTLSCGQEPVLIQKARVKNTSLTTQKTNQNGG